MSQLRVALLVDAALVGHFGKSENDGGACQMGFMWRMYLNRGGGIQYFQFIGQRWRRIECLTVISLPGV